MLEWCFSTPHVQQTLFFRYSFFFSRSEVIPLIFFCVYLLFGHFNNIQFVSIFWNVHNPNRQLKYIRFDGSLKNDCAWDASIQRTRCNEFRIATTQKKNKQSVFIEEAECGHTPCQCWWRWRWRERWMAIHMILANQTTFGIYSIIRYAPQSMTARKLQLQFFLCFYS